MSEPEPKSPSFSGAQVLRLLDEAGRHRLVEAGAREAFPEGAIVMQEGEAGDALFIILQGTVAILVDDFGSEKQVAELKDGALLGEMAVITNQPRSATVRAKTPLVALKIPKAAVLTILEDYPQAKELVARIGIQRTEDTFQKMLED